MNRIEAGMTGAEAQRTGAEILARAGVAAPRTDARLLLAHASGVSRDRMILMGDMPISNYLADTYTALLMRRAKRVPVSQITGSREFYGRAFAVTPDVLDPRPDTETLIEQALAARFERVLDLGTGSGCILLTLLAERPAATGLGTDLSATALTVARGNADALQLSDRAEFLTSDWFSAVEGQFDLIVSNPPYIAESEMATLEPEVRDHEPRFALTPGGDGLDAYRAIAAGVSAHLAPSGRLILEIGPTQASAVSALLSAAGLSQITVHCDLDRRDRVVEAFNED